MNCLIVDDEPIARANLLRYVEEMPNLKFVGECKSAIELGEILKTDLVVDLIFLDINMPMLSGIDFLRTKRVDSMVILTTAYSEYALEGYQLNVVDYLMKPISFDRFYQAIQKALEKYQFRSSDKSLAKKGKVESEGKNFMYVKDNQTHHKILFEKLYRIEAMQNYVKLFYDGKQLTILSTLKQFLEDLPESQFLQTHKSHVVNKKFIEALEVSRLKIAGEWVPVSRSFRDKVKETLL
jgi:DNA-binding LytR/AlgR family response regulator